MWEFNPESATRVGHPAPYPVELPARLIDLYTFRGDLVLDPFMGSGTTGVAAVRAERRFAGFDTDADYAEAALARIETARVDAAKDREERMAAPDPTLFVDFPKTKAAVGEDLVDFQRKSSSEGRRAQELASHLRERTGFGKDLTEKAKFTSVGVEVNFEARDAKKHRWLFDVSGAFSSSRPGLQRTDTLWKALGKAAVLATGHSDAEGESSLRYVLLTTDVPERGTAGYKALLAAQQDGPIWDVLLLSDPRTVVQLLHYASGAPRRAPARQAHRLPLRRRDPLRWLSGASASERSRSRSAPWPDHIPPRRSTRTPGGPGARCSTGSWAVRRSTWRPSRSTPSGGWRPRATRRLRAVPSPTAPSSSTVPAAT